VATASKAAVDSPIAVVTVELVGISLLALLASVSDDIGKLVVTIMAGVAVLWCLTHTDYLSKIVSKT
jgi:hypothetical protein